jgi:hypothetical protein
LLFRSAGKTEFLLKDLLPAAEARGYVTVDCMWQNRFDPLAALLAALVQPREPRSLGSKLQRCLLPPFKKTSVELELRHVGKVMAEAALGRTPGLSTARLSG